MSNIYFVVEMLRYNDREGHSYVTGVYDDETKALTEAWTHMKFRDGKYGAAVSGYILNEGNRVYYRELNSWDAFAACSRDLADKIKEIIKKEDLVSLEEKNETQ